MPARGQYHTLSAIDWVRALGAYMLKANREVARRFQTSYQTINRIRKRYRRTALFKDMPRSGQLKVTMRAED